jgi:hypothetical protein
MALFELNAEIYGSRWHSGGTPIPVPRCLGAQHQSKQIDKEAGYKLTDVYLTVPECGSCDKSGRRGGPWS